MTMRRLVLPALVAVLTLLAAPAVTAQTIYVDASASGAGDGSSWTDAFTGLQAAIDAASPGDQIWVAEGVYRPDTEAPINPGIRFEIDGPKDGIEIYGGFAGTETELAQRNPDAFIRTVLDGEYGDPGVETDNARAIVVVDGFSNGAITPATIIDGFLVSNADTPANFAINEVGGLVLLGNGAGASPTVRNVTFLDNASRGGGAVRALTANGGTLSPVFENVRFLGNRATGTSTASGGGVSFGVGGGAASTVQPTFTNVVFSGNTATTGGAAIAISGPANLTLTDVTLANNTSPGGNISNVNSGGAGTIAFADAILWDNSDPEFSAVTTFTNSTVQGGCAPASCDTADPLFRDADGADDVVGTLDDDLGLRAGSPALAAGQGATLAPAAGTPLSVSLTGAEGYRMLALPTGGTYDDLLGSLWTQGFTGSDDPGAADCTVFTWDETTGDFTTGYSCVSDQDGALTRGQGVYAFVYADDDLVTFGEQGGFPKTLTFADPGFADRGAPFTYGSLLTYTDNANTPAAEEGFNLLGNPLTAAFDWDLAVRGGGLTASIYVYDPNYLGGDYRTWTAGLGGDLPDGIVPAFQAFFAKAVAADPTLEIPVAAVVDPGPALNGKASGEAPDPLRLTLALGGEAVSVAFVALASGEAAPEAALGLDALDAVRMTPAAWPRTVLSTGTLGDDEPSALALNALPAGAAGEVTVPVSVTAAGHGAGPLALSVSWTGALPEGWAAALLDRETGETTPLATAAAYAFTAEAGADGAYDSGDRFALALTPGLVVGTGDAPEARFGLGAPAPNPARGTVRVPYALETAGEATLAVYDALGREVAVVASGEKAAGRHEAALDGAALAPGVYVVRLTSGAETATARLTVVR